ncbi:hypothetical protein TNCV_1598481 [Trichonephila clavipes]|nr:hypothetical protein TNCV_1598481 [Trichonephila clavipes]
MVSQLVQGKSNVLNTSTKTDVQSIRSAYQSMLENAGEGIRALVVAARCPLRYKQHVEERPRVRLRSSEVGTFWGRVPLFDKK